MKEIKKKIKKQKKEKHTNNSYVPGPSVEAMVGKTSPGGTRKILILSI